MRGRPSAAPASERVARAADAVLELGVTALATWTVVYHVCLWWHVRAAWAAAADLAVLLPCVWLYARRPERSAPAAAPAPAGRRSRARRGRAAVGLAAALAAAILFGWAGGAWTAVWVLWVVAAACGLSFMRAGELGRAAAPHGSGGALAALAWSAGLAAFSLFVVNPDSDDTQYVHLSAWVAAHGRFPLRDILFTDQALPAVFYPPVSSLEGLLGTLARGLPIGVPDLVYLVVTPVGCALAVLALWRLLRCWRVPMPGVALSVALVFLLFDAQEHWAPGAYFVGRMWQGKVLFAAVLVPLAFALLHDYARRPSRRGAALLAATGAAGVGLTTTAIFVVPVLAVAWLAPAALRRPRAALAGMAATAAYPLLLGVVTLAVGGRNPDEYGPRDILPDFLVHRALGTHAFGALALFAVLAAALAIPRRSAARMVAAGMLVLAVLYLHPVTRAIFDTTGLGRVLWRLMWVAPVAACVGALAVRAAPRWLPAPLRALPAAGACALMIVTGVPATAARAGGTLADHPAWKLGASRLASARAILAHAPGAPVVLAPQRVSQALLAISGTATTVDPLDRYVRGLRQLGSRAHVSERRRLGRFVRAGASSPGPPEAVAAALRRLHVDVACTPIGLTDRDALLAELGWRALGPVPGLSCRRPPA